MARHKMFGLTLIALLFAAFLSAAPASAGETAQPAIAAVGAAAALPVTCGLGVNLPNANAKGEVCAAEPASKLPDFLETSKRLGYCHCGCVNQRVCRTSADCGGASCDQAISCC